VSPPAHSSPLFLSLFLSQVLAKKILPDLLQTTGPLKSHHDASTTGLLLRIRSLRSKSVESITGCGGQAALLLTHENGSQCTVYLQGAHVTSYRGEDHVERLFTSSQSNFAQGKAIRGGIPLCFPQFSSRGPLPPHGFFRTAEWQVQSTVTDGSHCSVTLRLESSEATKRLWPHDFTAQCSVRLSSVALTVEVSIYNPSERESMSLTGALHSYLRVGAIERTAVHISARDYEDNLAGGAVCPSSSPVTFAAEVDRVYVQARWLCVCCCVCCCNSLHRYTLVSDKTQHEVTINDDARGSAVVLTSKNPDAVVWNPWVAKSKARAGRECAVFARFLCCFVSAFTLLSAHGGA